MFDSLQLQQHLFSLIKGQIGPSTSLVDEVAELLAVSTDSAYRRIRGEKLLDINETSKLCQRFKLSVDSILSFSSDAVNFQFNCVDFENFHFYEYLKYVLNQLELIQQFEEKELLFAAKDIPYFHYFQFEEITYFKSYFWMKLILEYPDHENKKFDLADCSPEITSASKQIWNKYLKTPSIEIWSNESINATLNQIEYCWDCGLFQNPKEAIIICNQMIDVVNHIEKQASLGNKFQFNSNATKEGESFKLYYNEVTISDNTILFKMDGQNFTYITHNLFNILSSSNEKFCLQTSQFFERIIKRSSLISQVSEKERIIFFRRATGKIESLRKKIEDEINR